MARTKYADHAGGRQRTGISRQEWSLRAGEFCARGQDLPQTKLLDLDVLAIRSAERQRNNLRKHISDNLSNKALAKQFGVHERTIEKVLRRESHCDIS